MSTPFGFPSCSLPARVGVGVALRLCTTETIIKKRTEIRCPKFDFRIPDFTLFELGAMRFVICKRQPSPSYKLFRVDS